LKRNIVIADNSELILNGLRSILQPLAGDGIVSFTKYAPLKEYLKDTKNILLIIDYTSKGFSLNKVVELKDKYPKMLVMALTPYTNAQTIVQAVEAGIESHIKKECSVQEIKDAFNATSGGSKFFCNDIVAQMRKENINPKNISFKSLDPNPVSLSDRELQIIRFIAEGYTNSQIAAIVYLSNHTVNTHRKNIMKKLGVNNTAGIVMYAVKEQMVTPNQFSFKKSNLV
jgi:DNA-binding NarL/FixJ family response regulator